MKTNRIKTNMLVARLPCGCAAAADFYPEDPTTAEGVMEWLLKDGYVVRMECRESISAEKCWRHGVLMWLRLLKNGDFKTCLRRMLNNKFVVASVGERKW